VRHCDDFEALLDVAHTRNADYHPLLSDSEVEKTARSAWDYEHNSEKENWVSGPQRVVLTGGNNGILPILYQNADALALYVKLQEAHGARVEPFAIPPKEMAAVGVIPAFKKSHHRYRTARDFLLKNGLIIKVHHGKGRTWRDGELVPDPHLFIFPSTPGPKSGPNITNTPPPWGYGEDQQ